MKRFLLFACSFSYWVAVFSDVTIVKYGDAWKYKDNGTDQGTAWRGTSLNDASWASGNAQLGYGDGDETTVVSAGCTPVSTCTTKYITTYFRKTINLASTSSYSSYTLNVKRDDGIVVYIDSTEVYRNNMPAGTILYTTAASTACTDDGNTIFSSSLPLSTMSAGTHVIAVEIHQSSAASSDISFDLELIAVVPGSVTLTRGPYLDLATQNSVHVRWRTDYNCNSVVYYGTDAASLSSSAVDNASTTEHNVTITGLLPDTKYYYSVGDTAPTVQTLKSGTNYFFTTLPVKGIERLTHIWAIGDCGNNSTNQMNVLKKYMQYMNGVHTDAFLLLGDNSYNSGYDNEYTTSFFPVYQDSILRNTIIWPSPGNHDYANNATRQNDHAIPYYDMFDLPTAGEAGGVASGNEAFYSYDFANIHFISLDSYGKESNTYRIWDTLGPQIVWLKSDLAANTQKWTIAYWHHPPYTLGSHSSETETDLQSIRTNVIRILERNGVDLILCGHSHVYERSYFINGHYGNEASFDLATQGISSSRGWYNDSINSCPYIKSSTQNLGTVYAVVGSSGQLGGASTGWPHAAMVYSDNSYGGGMAISVDGNRLDAEWVCSDGIIRDRFTMMKDVKKKEVYSIFLNDSLDILSSWSGIHNWTGGMTGETVRVSPPGIDTDTLIVTDDHNCLVDSFIISKALKLPVELISFTASKLPDNTVLLNWNTASEINNVYFNVEWSVDMIHFSSVGIVPGSGNSQVPVSYQLLHKNPVAGVNYYRLKQVNSDSSSSLSEVIAVKIDLQKPNTVNNSMYVYPNPSRTGIFEIDYYCNDSKKIPLQVHNMMGKIIFKDELNIREEITHYKLDLSAFPSGIYFLTADAAFIKIER